MGVRKLLLRSGFAPGDGVMLTAAVRDLHRAYPGQFLVDVQTPYADLWRYNPYVKPLPADDPALERLQCEYPLISVAERRPCHFLHGFTEFLSDKLGLQIRPTEFKGDIHLSPEEKAAPSQVEALLGRKVPYWLIAAGGKFDLTIKWWDFPRWQEVVDHFRDRILFVQVGDARHYHPRLRGALDLRGWTNLRQLIRLVHHAQGVLCPVTCLMHLAAAVQTAPGQPKVRPCVVVAGGREPVHWEAYPGHQFIHTIGALACCQDNGCWKSRIVPLGDGHDNDQPKNLCSALAGNLPRCMDMISAQEVIRRIETYFEGAAIAYLSEEEARAARPAPRLCQGTALDENSVTRSTARAALERYLAVIPPPPRRFEGRGIVIGASGFKYFVCAWVCLRMLRHLGCKLPIEIWHRGEGDWHPTYTNLVEPYDVTPMDTSTFLQKFPADNDHPFALKPYAVLHSSFREVLWLDADDVPVRNPEFLFETPEYREHGAVFWPDFERFKPDHPIWRLTGVPYRDEPEVQAGEIVVDKDRCARALALTLWFNHHHRFFYKYFIGDKDTWRFAWHKLGQSYAMPPFPVQTLKGTMCEHDFSGQRLFQHRNFLKWELHRPNPAVNGFLYEAECLQFLRELREELEPARPIDRAEPAMAEVT